MRGEGGGEGTGQVAQRMALHVPEFQRRVQCTVHTSISARQAGITKKLKEKAEDKKIFDNEPFKSLWDLPIKNVYTFKGIYLLTVLNILKKNCY